MKKLFKKVLCGLLVLSMFFTSGLVSNAAPVAEGSIKTSDGMDRFLSLTSDGVAVLDEDAAIQAGYATEVIEGVESNLQRMNELSKEYGVAIDDSFSLTIDVSQALKTRASVRGASKVVTSWNCVKLYMNSLETWFYVEILGRAANTSLSVLDSLSQMEDYSTNAYLQAVAGMVGVIGLKAWAYYYSAASAAQPGNGIILRFDADYYTQTTTLSFLSQ